MLAEIYRQGIDLKAARKAVLSRANLPALLAVVVVAIFGIFADHQNTVLDRQRAEADVLSRLSLVRAKLEGNLNGNIQVVRGLVAVIATEPEIDQARFAELARNIVTGDTQLRNIAGAPGMVISLMYPLAGNERALGLDYRKQLTQRDSALRAQRTRELVLAGPVELAQGGTGIIARFPVFIDGALRPDAFWGLVSAVVDAEKLYRDSGLLDETLGLELAIRGRDSRGKTGDVFFGPASLFAADTIRAMVSLPTGSWQIVARPQGGWPATAENAWVIRGLTLAAAFLLAVPLLVAGRLAEERRRNIAKMLARERDLELTSQRLKLALDVSRIGVWEADPVSGTLEWDDRTYELYGVKPGTPVVEETWRERIHPDDRERAMAESDAFIEGDGDYFSEFRIVLPDGTLRHQRVHAMKYLSADGKLRIIGAEWDVSRDVVIARDLKRAMAAAEDSYKQLSNAKARIERDALHDPLTSLPNRRYLDETLGRLESDKLLSAALLHIDLDRFKQINDTLGHAAGDAMLVHAARVLSENAGPDDFVARIGGDEFIVLRTGDANAARLSELAERIITRMRQPVDYEGHECRFGVSVGIARHSGPGLDAKRLLVNADIALYRAKSRGRNRHEFFTDDLQAEIVETKRTADDILKGLERNEFIAHYQPQFDARSFDIVGVEALARWNHPTRGTLRPDQFLGIAEELNVVATLDRMILQHALADLASWRAKGMVVPRVSVNVSARRLAQEDLVQSLRLLDIPADSVTFELVESIFLDDNDDLVIWNTEQIKSLGIDIEIDDFGTGYASIVSLLKLKPRRLKIDRQLVMPLVEQAAQRQLVQSIIEIGHSLGIEVVAEGVETMEHARILRLLGCDILQGFAFSGALEAQAFQSFVEGSRWRAAS